MAAVAPAVEKASDLMQKLSLEPKTKSHEAPAVNKKNSAIAASNRSVTPAYQNVDPNMYYYSNGYTSPYYFGGHDGMSYWDDYSRYFSHDGVEMTAGLYGDMYGYGYNTYGAYPSPASTGPTVGHDGQLYSQQPYQYPAPYFQPPSPAPYNPPKQNSSLKDATPATSSVKQQTPLSLEASKVKANADVPNVTSNVNSNGALTAPPKVSQQNAMPSNTSSYNRGTTGALVNGLSSFDGMRMPSTWFDSSTNNSFSSSGSAYGANSTALGRNQNPRSFSNNMGMQNQRPASGIGSTTSLMNRMYPNNRLYSAYNAGLGYRSSFYDSRPIGRWGYVDKYKPRGGSNGFYGYPNESIDGLTELNRGPRANRLKIPKGLTPTVAAASKDQNPSVNGVTEDSSATVPDKDQFNKEDFPVDYVDAKFFIIKSYSEDDLHKSVKYNVWASTPNGNKKLDVAYKESQTKATGCPIFLFFSVNTSGQFVGVAEMVGPVDFNKTVDYWQQDKWTGCFPVKWHIVKDVPNTILKHIILENNENKPVTNSRDTQEVKLEQGLQMLKIFKEHVSKTTILDDFGFYETRQKIMQEKRAKQQQLHKMVLVAKPVDVADDKNKEGETGKPKLLNLNETITVQKHNDTIVENGSTKISEENITPSKEAEDKVVENGVANGC